VEVIAGRWAAAERYADEALMLGEQIEAPIMVCDGLTISALVDALPGRVEEAREKVGRAREIAERVRSTQRANYALYTLGLLELSVGATEAAADAYRAVTDSGWTRWVCWAGARPAADAVEALCEVGDVERARAIAATLVTDARERPLTAACLATAAGDHDRAVELLRSASPAPVPFREARDQLLLGRMLRRSRRRADARAALTLARGGFDRLGAVLWVERVDEELSRLGGRSPAGATLTASERRVAELVAAGLSNKEVAAQLVVTVRTVEAHLSKIYAKLGVRGRSGLAAAWKEHAPE